MKNIINLHSGAETILKPYCSPFRTVCGNNDGGKNLHETVKKPESILILASDIFSKDNEVQKFLDNIIDGVRLVITGSWVMGSINSAVKKRLDRISSMKRLKVIKGDSDDTILSYVVRHIQKFRFTVVTHSRKLQIKLYLFSKKLNIKNGLSVADIYDGNITAPDIALKNAKPVFERTTDRISSISDEPMNMKGGFPKAGNRVRTQSGKIIRLGKTYGLPGGEADIYTVEGENAILAKIYRQETNTPLRYAKIKKLIEKADDFRQLDRNLTERIAFPLEILYNSRNEPVGYIMPYFTGTKHLDGRNIARMFPNASRREPIELAVSVAELANFTAQNNLFLCDVLSSGNVLFNEKREAMFIDIDSCQFTDDGIVYPANAGKLEYLSPEHVSSHEYGFIRNYADDAWSLAVVIYSILVVVYSTPYIRRKEAGTHVNAGFISDVENGMYDFRSDEKTSVIISSMPSFIQRDFYNTFSGNGVCFREEKRLSAEYWFVSCLRYLSELDGLTKSQKYFIAGIR